jgi:hypothetical protein
MIDIITLLLVIAVALGYRKIVDQQEEKMPNLTECPSMHPQTPETEYLPAVEVKDINASCFRSAGLSHQQGVYSVKDDTGIATS